MLNSIPGIITGEPDLQNKIIQVILRQKHYFTKEDIVIEVCEELIPETFKCTESNCFQIPGNPAYVVSPNKEYIKMLVVREINMLVTKKTLLAEIENGGFRYKVS